MVESTSSYGSDSRDTVSASFSHTTAIESEDKDTEWKDDTEEAGACDKDPDDIDNDEDDFLPGSGGASVGLPKVPPNPTLTLTQSSSVDS